MTLFDFWRSDILFWPGCYSLATNKDASHNYRRVLRKLGIKTTMTDKIPCCGGIIIDAGYDKEARKLARENLGTLRDRGITSIITSCPLCYKTFSKTYKQMLLEWSVKTDFVLSVVLKKLEENPKLIKKQADITRSRVVYRDSCQLGRVMSIYEAPRKILKLLGYEIVELPNNRENSLCCGTCGNLQFTNKELANKICQDFIKQLKKINANRLVVADSFEYQHLKENLKDSGIEVVEFSDILCEALGVWRI